MIKNCKVEYNDGSLILETEKGNFIVSLKVDDDYPGVYVDFESKAKNTSDFDESTQLALIELDKEDEIIRSIVWQDSEKQDPTHEITHNINI